MVAACPFPSLRGSQVLVRELAERLAGEGHTLHVVTYPTAQHLTPVARISIHRATKIPGLWTERPLGWQKPLLDLLLVRRLYRVIRRERIDLVHAHNIEAALVAVLVRRLVAVPVVYHAHNAMTDELPRYFESPLASRLAERLGAVLDGIAASQCDGVIGLSDRLAAFLAARGAAGRVNACAPLLSPPRPARERIVPAPRPTIAYAGNLDPYQDLPILLEAFSHVRAVLPTARLRIVTHPPTHRRVAERAARIAERPGVSVFSVSTFQASLRELARAHVLVCPRGSWSGFPIKILNYMHLGRPIVQARSSAHMVDHEVSGLLVEDGDPVALARALLAVLRDPDLAVRLGDGARRAASTRGSGDRSLQKIFEVYGKALAKPSQLRAFSGGGESLTDPTRIDKEPVTDAEAGRKEV